jgi:hypothetical protein
MKTNIKSIFWAISVTMICLVTFSNQTKASNQIEKGNSFLKENYSSTKLTTVLLEGVNQNINKANKTSQRDLVVWATGLPNRGSQKRMYRLDRGQRYRVRVSRFTHFGTWQPTRKALKNDACYEFNSRPRPVSLPVIKTNFGFNFCFGRYKANHIYESQIVSGNGSYLVMWVYDSDYRDNYGDYYVEVIHIRSR